MELLNMASIQTQIDTYLQDMLIMQFHVSNRINHKLTKGELREKFIHQMVLEQFPNLILRSGILCFGDWQSSQGDFLWLKDSARVGPLKIYDLNDCKMFMEVKSCATAPELRAIETTGVILKQKHSDETPISVGMFCYSTSAQARTVLKKFGFQYDNEIQSYSIYQPDLDQMKHVDFLYSLNISDDESETPYFVVRDYLGNCTLYQNNPVMQYFLNFFREN